MTASPEPVVFGTHDPATLAQMRACMASGSVVAGVLCADGHVGERHPVGGVIAYREHVSISGVGFDIGCGNMAVRLDVRLAQIRADLPRILADITRAVSFGTARPSSERAEHPLFDDTRAWTSADLVEFRPMARAQLGTVGGGNHFVDLFQDGEGFVWIGVHFGSRGLGHKAAQKYIALAGGETVPGAEPTLVVVASELGQRYLAAMALAGVYAHAGREWVTNRVAKIIGGVVIDVVHNHHNYAWLEQHGSERLWVVRRGATPAFPGQRGFVGGSMGEDAVIIQGLDTPQAGAALHSTVHGAGRVMGRREAKLRLRRADRDAWLAERGILLSGGGLDESPHVYRRLPDVLRAHEGTIEVVRHLRPVAVAMAPEAEIDPFKD